MIAAILTTSKNVTPPNCWILPYPFGKYVTTFVDLENVRLKVVACKACVQCRHPGGISPYGECTPRLFAVGTKGERGAVRLGGTLKKTRWLTKVHDHTSRTCPEEMRDQIKKIH